MSKLHSQSVMKIAGDIFFCSLTNHLFVSAAPMSEASKVGVGFGIFCSISFCYICMKCCCGGGNSSTEKEGAETPDAQPNASYQQVSVFCIKAA